MYTSNNVRANRNRSGPVVAIDGPAGSGKSTVAKAIAKMFDMAYVSTGLIYRALTLKALRLGVNVREPQSVVRLAETTEVAVLPDEVNAVFSLTVRM